MMNRAERRANGMRGPSDPGGVVDLAPLARSQSPEQVAQEAMMRRAKVVAVDIAFLAQLLQLDGTVVPTFEGWPAGGVIIAVTLNPQTMTVLLMVHHPDFPVRPIGSDPEMIQVKARFDRIVTKEEDDADPD